MHAELFHSPERPFRATPDIRFYFPHESVEAARQTVVRAVTRAEGPVMVLGGAGLGKSLLGMVVAEDLATRFDIVQLHAARLCSRRALLQSILFELKLPYRELSEGELRLSILARLEPSSDHAPDGVLIVVDEAHTLPAKLLDELRLITNFTRANQPRARLVLIGNLRLEDTFAEPQLESFNQRLAARCYLQTMNRQQTREYVFHQLTTAGFKPKELITEDAINSVYAASEGVPRLVNQVMDHSLALAATGSQCPVSSSLVEEAWADLQQLPAPWHAGADKPSGEVSLSKTALSTVEFGALDDDDDWGTSNETALKSATQVAPQAVPFHPSPAKPTAIQSSDCTTNCVGNCDNSSDDCDSVETSSDDELRLADEPTESESTQRTGNFFSAFVSPEETAEENYVDGFDDESTELDLAPEAYSFTEGKRSLTASSGQSTEEDEPREFRGEAPQGSGAADSFFRNRPTDEQLLALEDEQHGYDAMGVWENDPPLAKNVADVAQVEETIDYHTQDSSLLFGDDFDEELTLSPTEVKATAIPRATSRVNDESAAVRSHSKGSPHEGGNAARQAAEAADYIGRIQQYADTVAAANRGPAGPAFPSVDEILAKSDFRMGEDQLTQFAGQAALDTWSVDINTIDSRQEQAVQMEIEDMVSQLNFAAFSMESFSIEQIAIEPSDQRPQLPYDSCRSGKNNEIYTMHRPSEQSTNEQNGAAFLSQTSDDDRDLLVIEEELNLTSNAADESQRPVTKIAPYSQLFAKLRK